MIYPPSVLRENEFLASAFGYKQNHPWFQWRLGEDLTQVIPVLDELGSPVFDAHCACGVNRAIHTDPKCNWTSMVPRMEKVCIVPRLARNWVMSVWVPLEPVGYYCPVGDPEKPLYLKDDIKPSREETLLVMMAVTEHYSIRAAERVKRIRDAADERERVSMDPDQMGSAQKEAYQMLRDMAPNLKDEYGRTTQFHPQTGVGPSPAERKLIIEP